MDTSVPFAPDYLATPAFIADPYPAYQCLREQSPFPYVSMPAGTIPGLDEPLRAWALMTYTDVYGALRDHETFSSLPPAQLSKVGAFPPFTLIFDDPPRHTRFRRLVNKAFTLKRIDALEPWITSVATELLDALGAGECEVIESFTVPFPMTVIARLLGIPAHDAADFKRWSDALFSFTALSASDRRQTLEELTAYFGRLAAARRAYGAEDLLTALVEADVEGEALQEWEILQFCILLLSAGNETTTNLIGNMVNLLAERPGLWQQVRADRSLVEPIIEETLRYEGPVQRLHRITTREVTVSGVTIPPGELIWAYFGAANRDPSAFPHPEEFRLDRDLHNHMAFGMGIHYCLGAPLARAEARIALNAFLDRFSSVSPGSTLAVRQTFSSVSFGFQQLPLVLKK